MYQLSLLFTYTTTTTTNTMITIPHDAINSAKSAALNGGGDAQQLINRLDKFLERLDYIKAHGCLPPEEGAEKWDGECEDDDYFDDNIPY